MRCRTFKGGAPARSGVARRMVGTRSRASRRRLSDNDIRCGASDRRWFPARPAEHVHRRRNNGKDRIESVLASARDRNVKRRVETCNAGRAGAHLPSEALHPTRSSDVLPRIARERVPTVPHVAKTPRNAQPRIAQERVPAVEQERDPPCAGARLPHGFCFRREATAHSVLRYDAWKHAVEEIIYSAGFRSAAGHLESAEWVATNDCTGDGPIDVEVSDQKFRTHPSDVLRAARVKAASERKWRIIGEVDGLIQVVCRDHDQNRAKDLFLRQMRG